MRLMEVPAWLVASQWYRPTSLHVGLLMSSLPPDMEMCTFLVSVTWISVSFTYHLNKFHCKPAPSRSQHTSLILLRFLYDPVGFESVCKIL